MSTNDLFGDKPRRRPRVLMHVYDAGYEAIKFKCSKCGFSDWYHNDMSVSEAKRGIPCPECNITPEKQD